MTLKHLAGLILIIAANVIVGSVDLQLGAGLMVAILGSFLIIVARDSGKKQ